MPNPIVAGVAFTPRAGYVNGVLTTGVFVGDVHTFTISPPDGYEHPDYILYGCLDTVRSAAVGLSLNGVDYVAGDVGLHLTPFSSTETIYVKALGAGSLPKLECGTLGFTEVTGPQTVDGTVNTPSSAIGQALTVLVASGSVGTDTGAYGDVSPVGAPVIESVDGIVNTTTSTYGSIQITVPVSGSVGTSSTVSGIASAVTNVITTIDNFEAGTNNATLGSPWTKAANTSAIYTTINAMEGTKCAELSSTLAGNYGQIYETTSAGKTINGVYYTFSTKFDLSNQYSQIWAAVFPGSFAIQFAPDTKINIYTNRSGITGYTASGWTQVGNYEADVQYDWTITLNFSTQKYTLTMVKVIPAQPSVWVPDERVFVPDGESPWDEEAQAFGYWTIVPAHWTTAVPEQRTTYNLKSTGASDYNIPFCDANTISQTQGISFYSYYGNKMWIDNVKVTVP